MVVISVGTNVDVGRVWVVVVITVVDGPKVVVVVVGTNVVVGLAVVVGVVVIKIGI